jgi:tRNA(Leu) C34 or U34 (ribose-2'-O)-methylase TrmL
MSIESYKLIAKAPAEVLPKALELFSKTAAEVCEGQQYDMDFEDMECVPMSDYLKMIGLKTAVLIACSAKMGAIIGGASAEDCDLLYKYGYDLGLAFQITDDWLDTYGDPAVFGKAIGGDIVNNKKSWLMTRAFEKADEQIRGQLLAAMEMPVGTDEEKAAKVAAVIVCDRTTDIHNPNVVRASTGTMFSVPIVEATSDEALTWLKAKGFKILAATPHAEKLHFEVELTGNVAIALGAEQYGLTAKWMDGAELRVRIPMLGLADSLNVSAAATILVYEAVRQRIAAGIDQVPEFVPWHGEGAHDH